MNKGRGKDQLKCPRGVTAERLSHKVLFCMVQGNGIGPGYVFLFKGVTPGDLPLEGLVNLRETGMYLHHPLRGNCFPCLAFHSAQGVVRAAVLPGKTPEDQINKLCSLSYQLPGATF